MVVRTGENTADVMWDYVTLPPRCDKVLFAHQGEIRDHAMAIYARHATKGSGVRAKPTVVFFDNLTIEGAKSAANELYAVIESLLQGQGFAVQ